MSEKTIHSKRSAAWNKISLLKLAGKAHPLCREGDMQALLESADCLHNADRTASPELSLVIPAFNEAERIGQTMEEIIRFFGDQQNWEVLIVDDGSTDSTSDLVSQYYSVLPSLSHFRLKKNWGKGGAVRFGLHMAKGRYVFFCDADLSFPLDQLSQLACELGEGADVVVGKRVQTACQPAFRRCVSAVFRKLVCSLGLTSVEDTQCGFKGFSREALEMILPKTRCIDFAFDVEMLAIASRNHMKIAEAPVGWEHRAGSTIRLGHMLQTALSLVRIHSRLKEKGAADSQGLLPWRSPDAVISVSLFIAALLFRLPYLYDVPHFIDEWGEVGLSAQISRGEIMPLHNTAHDIGAFYNYLLAGLFYLFGHHLFIPRLFVTFMSAGTVVLTYWIARHWLNKNVSLFAAMLLATNSMHILITHMAWSNDITPFFVSLAFLLTLKAMERQGRIIWAASGTAWALALQTHSSVLAALIGVFFYLMSKRGWKSFHKDSCVRTGMLFFLMGYSNMILLNIVRPLDSFFWIHRKDYALNDELNLSVYIRNTAAMGSELLRSLSSAFPDGQGPLYALSSAVMLVMGAALLYGLYGLYGKRDGFLVHAMLISSFLVIPLFNSRYVYYISTRYIAYLFPVCMVAVAAGFSILAEKMAGFLEQRGAWKLTGIILSSLLFFCLPLHHFYNYAEAYMEEGLDNSAEFTTVKRLLALNLQRAQVIVDREAKQAAAVGEMLKVKGLAVELVGKKPQNEDDSAFPQGLAQSDYMRWRRAFLKLGGSHHWYAISAQHAGQLTKYFDIKWKQKETITGASGRPAYVIGQITSLRDPVSGKIIQLKAG